MSMRKKDILLQMAIELGVADYPDATDDSPALPADTSTLKRLRDAYENARTTLFMEDPRFSFSRPELVLTLDPTGAQGLGNDAGRYALPTGVIAPPIGRLTLEYPVGTTGQGWDVEVTSWARVNSMRASNSTTTGAPRMAAFWLLQSSSDGNAPRYEMRLDRKPDLAYVLRAPFQVEYAVLDDDDVEPSGYPLAVKAYAIWEVQKANPIATGPSQAIAQAEKVAWLARVTKNEQYRMPRKLGRSAPAIRRSRRGYSGSDRVPQWQDIPTTLSDGSML